LADSAERRAIGGNSQLDPEERALLLDAAAVLPSDPPQTCRDHGPHLGFHWCPECYQRAYAAGWGASRTALEGALEWCIDYFEFDSDSDAVLAKRLTEFRALLSAPAAAGSAGQEKT
jgi:hypothetical protein